MPAREPQHGRALQLRPIKSPGGNAYAFGNLYEDAAFSALRCR
jgi:vesicle-fusing ATPase